MLFGNIPFDSLDFFCTVVSTVIVCFVFLGMSIGYTQKRAHKRYAAGKEKAPSITIFTTLSKVLFVSGMLLTLVSYWLDLPSFLRFHDSNNSRMIGVLFVFLGYIGLQHSFAKLDKNYSPLFDAYKPFSLTTSGIYRHIRHPIYLFNLFVSFGLALSSGMYIVILTALIGFGFVLKAMLIEEEYLKQQFSEYDAYCLRTWRLIPYIF